jgi:hypothetical protein
VIPLSALSIRDGHDTVRTIVQRQCERGLADVRVTSVARNTQSVAVRGVSPGDLVVLSSDDVPSGRTFQCQAVAVRTNPSFDDLQFSGRPGADAKTAMLVPGPKPKSVLQRFFGV